MTSPIFAVRVNLDHLAADLDQLEGDAEYGAWLRGFRAGARGGPCRWEAGTPAAMGHARGAAALAETIAFQERQSGAGKASAAARAATTGSAQPKRSAEPATERRSNGVRNQAPNQTPNGDRTTPRTAAEPIQSANQPVIQEASQPAASAPTAVPRGTETDPRLAAAAAAGAYVDFKGQDLRPEWLVALGTLSPEQIAVVFQWERAESNEIIRMPSSFAAAHVAMLEHHAKAKAQTLLAAERERSRAGQQTEEERKRAVGQVHHAALRARAKRVLDHCATETGWEDVQDALGFAIGDNAVTLQRTLDQLPPALRKIADTVPQEVQA